MKKITGAILALAAAFSLAGCIFPIPGDGTYRVYYNGNGNTDGAPPVDNRAYNSGDTAVVMEKPDSLKNGNRAFLGWQRDSYSETQYSPGIRVTVYEDITFYAAWEGALPFLYALDSVTGEATITGYQRNYDTDRLIIPDTLEGKPVTRIGANAFSGKYLYEVILPGSLVSIGESAFRYTNIKDIVIPDTVREIGANAFDRSNLSTLTLGAGLESVGNYAFSENNISVLFLPQNLTSIGAGAFYQNPVTVVEIGGNINIGSETSMGVYGKSFQDYYNTSKQKAAGIYRYDRSVGWKGPAKD